jgi:Family of unknown function (DUF5906)
MAYRKHTNQAKLDAEAKLGHERMMKEMAAIPPAPIPESERPNPAAQMSVPKQTIDPTMIDSLKGELNLHIDGRISAPTDPIKQRPRYPNDGLGDRLIPISARYVTYNIRGGGQITVPKSSNDLWHVMNSDLEAYRIVKKHVATYGFDISYDSQGHGLFSNHTVYRVDQPEPEEGVTYPRNFWIKKKLPMRSSSEVIGAVGRAIEAIGITSMQINDAMENEMGITRDKDGLGLDEDEPKPKPRGKGKGFSSDQDWGSDDAKAKEKEASLNKQIKGRLKDLWRNFDTFSRPIALCGNKDYDPSKEDDAVSMDGYGVAVRWVPKLDWFRDDLNQISNEQLLSLVPDAEREVLMLSLGRSLLGREGGYIYAGHDHMIKQPLKWRSLLLMEGREGGLGRSTLLDYLSNGFASLGYEAGVVADMQGKFSHGRTATKDFAYQDDMSAAETVKAIGSSIMKTMVSGGRLSVEEKGQPAYEVEAQGVYMLCTNKLELDKLSDLDAGNISRLMAMKNYTTRDEWYSEYKQKYGYKLNTDVTYKRLSQQYGVSINCLVKLLLARCADKFREWVVADDQEGLVDHLMQLRSQFVIQTNMRHLESLLKMFLEFYMIKKGKLPLSFSINTIIEGLRNLSAAGEQIPDCADSPELVATYATNSLSNKRGQPQVAKLFFESLTSSSGMSYPTNLSEIAAKYFQVASEIPKSVATLYDRAREMAIVPGSDEHLLWKRYEEIHVA